jgi:hypothetical protein
MALQPSRVAELSDEVVAVATELIAIHARARRLLAVNTALAVSFTPATKTATIANATDIWTSTAHGLLVDQKVRLTNSGGALPTGFLPFTDYWVIAANLAANTFQLSASKGGATVNATTDGTGTHTVNPVPDYIAEETNGTSNISGRTFDRTQVSNGIGSITQFDNMMRNILPTQGDHLGNLAQLSRASGA